VTDAVDAGVEVVVSLESELGEGPVWDARTGRIVWVDILGKLIHETDPATGRTNSIPTPSLVGAVVPRASGGFVAAVEDGFWAWDASGWHQVAAVEDDRPDLRFNDGKCDAAGRFWAGSMSWPYQDNPWAGSLYRLDPDHTVARMLDGVWISNGLCWSADNETMFYIDTKRRQVEAFRFDIDAGTISDRRTVVEISPDAGSPDGMAIDVEGGLWVAMWGGWSVHRYFHGSLDRVVRLPVAQPSSCAFGGPKLDVLYITTAKDELDDTARREQPLAGALFRFEPGIAGQPVGDYRG